MKRIKNIVTFLFKARFYNESKLEEEQNKGVILNHIFAFYWAAYLDKLIAPDIPYSTMSGRAGMDNDFINLISFVFCLLALIATSDIRNKEKRAEKNGLIYYIRTFSLIVIYTSFLYFLSIVLNYFKYGEIFL